MAKVSIIVPIYNVEKYVGKCLESLISQTFKDIEIWAVIDGSPDNSVDIVKKYAKKDKRVKCIEKENGGYGSVLEYTIANIKSEYFLICDPDDWISPDAIEKLYGAAKDNDLDFVMANRYDVYSDNGEEVPANISSYPYIVNPKLNFVYNKENGIDKFIFLPCSPHAKLYKTELARNIKFPKKVSFTDYLLYVLFCMKMEKAMYIDTFAAYYLFDREGNSVSDTKPHIADYYSVVINSVVDQYEKNNYENEYFYYQMFLKSLDCNYGVARIADRNAYNEKCKLMYKFLKRLIKNRKKIIYLINKYEKGRKKVAYKLLLNPLTSKFTFIYFSNKMYKRIH